jgi:hypothetical protein
MGGPSSSKSRGEPDRPSGKIVDMPEVNGHISDAVISFASHGHFIRAAGDHLPVMNGNELTAMRRKEDGQEPRERSSLALPGILDGPIRGKVGRGMCNRLAHESDLNSMQVEVPTKTHTVQFTHSDASLEGAARSVVGVLLRMQTPATRRLLSAPDPFLT